jgi:hypothetical protein
MPNQTEMVNQMAPMEKVRPYPQWMTDVITPPPATGKVPNDSLKSHSNSRP